MSGPEDSQRKATPVEEEDPFTSPGFKALEDPEHPKPDQPDDVTLRDAMPPEGVLGDAILTPPKPPTQGFRLATDLPARPIVGRSGPDAVQLLPATKRQPDVTRPMSPIPGAVEPLPAEQLQSASRHVGSRAPVLAPDPQRVFPESLSQPPAPPSGSPATAEGERARSRRRLSIAVLAVVMFLACFVGTGSMILWVASGDGAELGPSVAAPQGPTAPAPPSTAAAGPQPLTKLPTPIAPRPAQPQVGAAEESDRAATLIRLGDEETQRIRPYTDIQQAADLDQAIAVPRGHYDAAQVHYNEAGRHDSTRLQCVLVRMGASAEQLASALDETAEAPEVLAVAPERFIQELRDTAANYRSVARRTYQRATGQPRTDPECESLAVQGVRRTTSALQLPQ